MLIGSFIAVILLGLIFYFSVLKTSKQKKSQLPSVKAEPASPGKTLTYHKSSAQQHRQVRVPADRHKAPRGPLFALFLTLFGASLLILWAWLTVHRHAEYKPAPTVSQSETLLMYYTGGQMLGSFVKEHYTGGKVVVLLPPLSRMTNIDHVALRGLEKQCGDSLQLTQEHLPPIPEGKKTAAYIPAVKSFSNALREHRDKSAIISLVGLPDDPGKLVLPGSSDAADLVVMNTAVFRLRRMIERGLIAAVLVKNPKSDTLKLNADNPENWLIVTPANIRRITEKFPSLFAISRTLPFLA